MSNILGLINFVPGETYAEQERAGEEFRVESKILAELARSIAIKNPLWLLTAAQAHGRGTNMSGAGIRNIHAINVLHDGIELGVIRSDYSRGKGGVSMTNLRIRQDMERSSSIFTSDMKKALTIVRKYFVKPSTTEKLDKTTARAEQLYYGASNQAQGIRNRIDSDLLIHVKDFALNEASTQFALYLKNMNYMTALSDLEKRGPAVAEMLKAEEAFNAFKGGRMATIVISGRDYIVKTLDNVQVYDDTTLPEHLKGKLGMLKLVESEQVVTGIGCRVSVDAYIVTLDDPELEQS